MKYVLRQAAPGHATGLQLGQDPARGMAEAAAQGHDQTPGRESEAALRSALQGFAQAQAGESGLRH